jgi:hypothetical protein
MKRIFTFSVLTVLAAVLFNSCVKNYSGGGFDESYWLAKERGEVVYSDSYCNYFVVETYYGYNIVQAYGGYKPYEGAVVYGNFSSRGTRDFYNRTTGYVFSGSLTDYWLTYSEAQDALDYYCPLGKAGKREFKTATQLQDNK